MKQDENARAIGPGKIILKHGYSRLWPDTRFFTNRFSNGLRSGKFPGVIMIEQHKRTREWRCNCEEFESHNTTLDQTKTCEHLADLGIPGGGEPFEASISILSGFRLKVAKRRAKVKNTRTRKENK